MKKFTIRMLPAILTVFCLMIAGCGNVKDKSETTGENQESVSEIAESGQENMTESSVNEGLITETEENSSNAITDADGYYNWQVGNYGLRTKINVYDYIDQGSRKWNANDMALAIGWGDWEDRLTPINKEGFGGYGMLLKYAHSNGSCNAVNVFGTDQGTIGIICNIATDSYTMNNTSFNVSIEYIIISAYAMENFTSTSVDPFAGIAPAVGGAYRFDE